MSQPVQRKLAKLMSYSVPAMRGLWECVTPGRGRSTLKIARSTDLPYDEDMKKADALARLKPFERRLRERGISALYLFGSTARDEAGETSDLDLLFETDPAYRFSLFDQAGIMAELSDHLQTKVDFVPRKALKPYIRRHVESDLVRVF